MKKQITYEEAMKQLQDIIADLENDKVTVDDLPKKVQQANTLLQLCKGKLRSAEEGVMQLMDDND